MSLLSTFFGSKSQTNSHIKLLSPLAFKNKIENRNVQVIDVRTALEYKSGHIRTAKNIDFLSGKFNIEFNKLNKEKPIYLYCRSGHRSRQAANKLAGMGFIEIYDLQGGIMNY